MNTTLQDTDAATLEELEARARKLESELAGVQAAIAMLRGTAGGNSPAATGQDVPLTPAWDAPIPIATPPQSQPTDSTMDTGYIYLQALPPYHALRAKWGLGSGLEDAQAPEITMPAPAEEKATATELRLFGLLREGTAWEQRIPFTAIAEEAGIVLGRDRELAHIILEDPSVSRAHLRLHLNEHGLVISDLGSTNGSALNGAPINTYNNCRPVLDGDTLTLGSISLQVEFI